ncbi:uncharacterized protein LOC134238840 [Saccostrea cucullata]|uniref:uncharacterized protein LOC134238840 n=1 Tax=Saccostrea cuccullata TaxID=36930 RepID=UPI002ED35926
MWRNQLFLPSRILERLNQVHITLSHETKRNILNDFGEYSTEKIIQGIAEGKDGKLNGDNLDLYVTTNDVRMDNRNQDYHFFATDLTFDRVDIRDLDDSKPVGDAENITYKNFVPSPNEISKYKESLKVLLGRILCEYFDHFSWMKTIIPAHIPHDQKNAMSKKSEVFILPVLLKNETSLSDCIHILKSYEQQLISWYTKAGRASDLDDIKVPVGGDQLTRVRLQSAKALQDGALTATDRLEHLDPMIVEMFHTLMDLLEKLYKRFFNTASGREKGTLYHIKVLIERSNVNGKVKSRFEAHEDFILTVGCAYFLSYILHFFGMKTLTEEPQHPLLSKKNMKMLHNPKKEEIFSQLLGEIVDKLMLAFPEKPQFPLTVDILGACVNVNSTINEKGLLNFQLEINNTKYIFRLTPEQVKRGETITLSVSNNEIPVTISQAEPKDEDADGLQNYVMQFLQWYFIILTLKDAIKEGDSCRTNITLKFCIPIFFSHSVYSKYLEECIDYILKTEIMLSEKMAMKVRYGSFVNLSGRGGENKAADLQKENEVMVLKELIRGLGSNKTEKAIVTITKAAPVIQDVVCNFDRMLGLRDKKTHHKKRSFQDDVKCILKELLTLKIWEKTNGRQLENFPKIAMSPFAVDTIHFKDVVMKKVQRLKRGIVIPSPATSDDESDTE